MFDDIGRYISYIIPKYLDYHLTIIPNIMPISGYFQFSNSNSFGILSDPSGSRHVVDTVVAVVILVVAQTGGATDFGLMRFVEW